MIETKDNNLKFLEHKFYSCHVITKWNVENIYIVMLYMYNLISFIRDIFKNKWTNNEQKKRHCQMLSTKGKEQVYHFFVYFLDVCFEERFSRR